MTIEIRQQMGDLENPTEKEVIELAITLNMLDVHGIEYDLNPPIKKETGIGK